jgi:hypothetical protein
MGILAFFRKIIPPIFLSDEEVFRRVTPEFLSKQRVKMITPQKYFKWLMAEYFKLGAIVEERKIKRTKLPEWWIEKAEIIEKEIKETGNLLGISPLKNEEDKLSRVLRKIVYKI